MFGKLPGARNLTIRLFFSPAISSRVKITVRPMTTTQTVSYESLRSRPLNSYIKKIFKPAVMEPCQTYHQTGSNNIGIKNQTNTSMKPCPNRRCSAIIPEQTLFGDELFPVWTPCLIVFDKIWRTPNICPNTKTFCSFGRLASQYIVNMFGSQTMFDRVWLPNISRLD